MCSDNTVLVTAFGPFQGHPSNASWAAALKLYEMRHDLYHPFRIKLIIEQLPVVYDHVKERVPQLWKEHNPQIVLHLGVSDKAQLLVLEHKAHGSGYVRPDINGKCPTEKFDESSSLVLETGLDVNQLVHYSYSTDNVSQACVSHDAGRYLCEYTYYQSLCINPKRTLFVHVPNFNRRTSEEVARWLYELIELIVGDYDELQ